MIADTSADTGPSFARGASFGFVPASRPGVRVRVGIEQADRGPRTAGRFGAPIGVRRYDGIIRTRSSHHALDHRRAALLRHRADLRRCPGTTSSPKKNRRRLVRLQAASCGTRAGPWSEAALHRPARRALEPVQAATMRTNELAREVVAAFARALEVATAHRRASLDGRLSRSRPPSPTLEPGDRILGFLVRGRPRRPRPAHPDPAEPRRRRHDPRPAIVSTGRIEGPLDALLLVATTRSADHRGDRHAAGGRRQSLLHERWGIPSGQAAAGGGRAASRPADPRPGPATARPTQ